MASYGIAISLPLPSSGQTQWDGPLNDILQAIIDVISQRVGVEGLDINATLDVQGNEIANALNLSFVTSGDPGLPNTVFYNSSGELCCRNSSNQLVQITSGGVVNVAGSGGFGGDYVSSNQNGASYANSTQTFSFTASGGTVYATVEHGAVKVHEGSTANAITLRSPASLASAYTLTFPGALNAGNPSLVTCDATGGLNVRSINPTGRVALVTADITGNLNYRLSASFTECIDACAMMGATGVYAGDDGWVFTSGPSPQSVDIPIRFQEGDRIDELVFGTNTMRCTGTLYHRTTGGGLAVIARASFNAGIPDRILNSSTPTLTGTLPFTPPTSSGSLFLRVQNSIANSGELYNCLVNGMRKIIS